MTFSTAVNDNDDDIAPTVTEMDMLEEDEPMTSRENDLDLPIMIPAVSSLNSRRNTA